MQRVLAPIPNMPAPIQTFAGLTSAQACGTCVPPDSDGDVGPNHYINSVNSSIRIFDKLGNPLTGPTTYNSFFSAMGPTTPCGLNQNDGDGVVFYDHLADRWVVSDFAFPAFPGVSFYQCVGVSKTSDPVSGGWWLYAIQVDPANPTYLGDYPKFGMWPDAYYLSMNEFSNNTTFNGVRVYALDRNSMVNGGSANAIGFSIFPADLGDQYSLVPASFRTGDPPPAGQPEWFMDVNSSATAGTVENQVFVRRFHVDFVTPANSTFGVGASHLPDGIITVNGFKDAFNATNGHLCPNGTATYQSMAGYVGRQTHVSPDLPEPQRRRVHLRRSNDRSRYRRSDCADRGALVSVRHDRQHNSGYACAAAGLEQWSRRVVSLDGEYQRGLAGQRRDRLFHLQHHPQP